MSTVEKVSVALSPELAAMVKDAVATGRYASAGEVIREALRDWRTREDVRDIERARLQAAWRQGVESGQAAPFDLDAVKSAARERLETVSKARKGA
jgi:antitoxin ParD1/3/4